jgi:hypothetical protein
MASSEETRRRAAAIAQRVLHAKGYSKSEKTAAGLGLSDRVAGARTPSASAYALASKTLNRIGSSQGARIAAGLGSTEIPRAIK